MVGGEHSLKISAPQLLWFGIDSTLNIFPQTITELINQSVNYAGDCRTASATPGLLNIACCMPESVKSSCKLAIIFWLPLTVDDVLKELLKSIKI